jgi:phage shock protein A
VAEELQAKASKDIEARNKEDAAKQDLARELAMLKQQLEGALQEVETQRALNDKAAEDTEQSETKIRELEDSLKAVKAELTEATTARVNGADIGDASPDVTTPTKTDGEDRGAAIQGMVCVQARQGSVLSLVHGFDYMANLS